METLLALWTNASVGDRVVYVVVALGALNIIRTYMRVPARKQ
jgi:hypothetical protein